MAAALLALVAVSGVASASPWVLPHKKAVVAVTAGVGFAGSDYLPDRVHQDFPLNGTFHAYQMEVLGRVGLGLGFEVSLKATLKGVSYVTDPALLVDDKALPSSADGYRDAVFNFSTSEIGMGDIYIGVAHQHLKSPLRLASVVELKFPTGYSSPEQTFKDGQFGAGNISDDVAIGDSQVDLLYSFQVGYFLGVTRTALELNIGYCVRFNGLDSAMANSFRANLLGPLGEGEPTARIDSAWDYDKALGGNAAN